MPDPTVYLVRDLWTAAYADSEGFHPRRCFPLDGQPTVVFEFSFSTELLETVNEYSAGRAHPEVGSFNRSRVRMRQMIDEALGRAGRSDGCAP